MAKIKPESEHRAGVCPVCGGNDLSYTFDETFMTDDDVTVPYECRDCGLIGSEVLATTFLRHEVDENDNEQDESEDDDE